jgi:hypothetical protein
MKSIVAEVVMFITGHQFFMHILCEVTELCSALNVACTAEFRTKHWIPFHKHSVRKMKVLFCYIIIFSCHYLNSALRGLRQEMYWANRRRQLNFKLPRPHLMKNVISISYLEINSVLMFCPELVFVRSFPRKRSPRNKIWEIHIVLNMCGSKPTITVTSSKSAFLRLQTVSLIISIIFVIVPE